MKVVIIGGVAAGASAAARLRRLDEAAEIVILEKGEYVSFANCGLPYHISGAIDKRRDLLVATPAHLRETFNIDVRTGHEAMSIDRAKRSVGVREAGGRQYGESYDRLILCQGAEAVRPAVPGADHPGILSMRSMDDMDAVKAAVDSGARTAVIIGANYIGLEVAESLRQREMTVDLIEIQNQIMPALDPEMATDLKRHLEEKGVRLHLGGAAESFRDVNGRVEVSLTGGGVIDTDMVVLAMGVRPASALARAAGLELGMLGAVKVDAHMRTSDPDIYAAGDMVEVTDTVTGLEANIPLAGPANRQGRIAADNICGRDSAYDSTQGTAIVKVFDMTAAITGASERTLARLGTPYHKFHLYPFSHASYYPGAVNLLVKVLFAPGDGRLLGAQAVGFDGVDKRIDLFAAAVRTGMSVRDLEQLELAYAPPYSSAKDPVNMAGFVGANMLDGIVRMWYSEEFPERTAAGTVLDVRTAYEFRNGAIPGAVHIPLNELRRRLPDLAGVRGRPLFVYCLSGVRSYIACRMLEQSGFSGVFNLSGGIKTFSCVHPEVPLAR